MIAAVKNYFAEMGAAIGQAWNRCWFTPMAATTLGALRVAAGLMAFYAVATYAPDLERWFSPTGMMPVSMIGEMGYTGAQSSLFDFVPMNLLWPAYWASLAVLALYTLGIGGRVICILAAVATLSFFARTPLVTGEFETILAVLLVYLCVGRACDAFSVRSLVNRSSPAASRPAPLVVSNTIALRLLQIHIATVHLMMGCAQLSAPEGAWWTGEGIWLAAMRPGMALVDFTFLTDHPRVVAAWSHAMTLYLLAFAPLVWWRLTRPIVLAIGILVWVSFALTSGWLMFSLAMLAGLAAFVEPAALEALVAPMPAGAGKG